MTPDSPTAAERPWQDWADARPAPELLHLDSASCGRASRATLGAVAAHTLAESRRGGYVAQLEAEPVVQRLRADLAGLLGLVPGDGDGVALVESAAVARDKLLAAWPLPAGARIGVAATEWGPNVDAFTDAGLVPVPLAVDGDGRVDLEALDTRLRTDPVAVVHLVHLAAHRGVDQPVAQAVEVAHRHGVPLWLDCAQSTGHLEVPAGPDAAYGTSRKWLAGPRGVGFLAVAPQHRDALVVRRPAKYADAPVVHLLDSDEAHVGGRVGLAHAVSEHLALGPAAVHARLGEIGRLVRAAVTEVPGWQVADPGDARAAIVGLRPVADQDVSRVRARLLTDHGVLVTAGLAWRSPLDRGEELLRISGHVDVDDAALEDLVDALAAAT